MRLVVELTDHGVKRDVDFQVVVDSCVVTGMQTSDPSITSYEYNVKPNPDILIIPNVEVTLEPEYCAYHGVVYEWTVEPNDSGELLPPFASQVENGLQISTNDDAQKGNYLITLTVEPNGPNSVDPIEVSFDLSMSACYRDEITIGNDIASFTYIFGEGQVILQGDAIQKHPECNLVYSLIQEGYETYPEDVITFNSATGEIIFETTDVETYD